MRIKTRGEVFFPQQCACCGGTATTRFPATGAKSQQSGDQVIIETISYDVPNCSGCVEHILHAEDHQRVAKKWAAGGALVVGLIAYLVRRDWQIALVAAAFGTGITWAVAAIFAVRRQQAQFAASAPDCTRRSLAVEHVKWDGDFHTFEVLSRQYAALFLVANKSSVVEPRNGFDVVRDYLGLR